MSAHTWGQIGTRDAEGFRTFTIPGDVCLQCSSRETGKWVPVSQCGPALVNWEEDHKALAACEGEGGS